MSVSFQSQTEATNVAFKPRALKEDTWYETEVTGVAVKQSEASGNHYVRIQLQLIDEEDQLVKFKQSLFITTPFVTDANAATMDGRKQSTMIKMAGKTLKAFLPNLAWPKAKPLNEEATEWGYTDAEGNDISKDQYFSSRDALVRQTLADIIDDVGSDDGDLCVDTRLQEVRVFAFAGEKKNKDGSVETGFRYFNAEQGDKEIEYEDLFV